MKKINILPSQFMLRFGSLLALTLMLAVGIVAQSLPRVAGELSQAKRTTLNGRTAVAGSTVFNHTLIKTAQAGSAVITLGKQGRIEFAENSEMAMLCDSQNVGGELKTGRTVVSAPQGVAISVLTSKGLISSEPGSATVLTIEQTVDQMRVVAHRGAARIVSGNRSEPIVAGEELSLNTRAKSGWQRKQVFVASAGTISASLLAITAGKNVQPVLKPVPAANAVAKTSFSTLFNAGINYSFSRVASPPIRHPEVFFESNITCRDSDSFLCRRKSQATP